jgi:hypothetical protein
MTRWFRTKCICPRCRHDSQSPRKPKPGETCSLCQGNGWAWDLNLLPEKEARFVNKAVEAFCHGS